MLSGEPVPVAVRWELFGATDAVPLPKAGQVRRAARSRRYGGYLWGRPTATPCSAPSISAFRLSGSQSSGKMQEGCPAKDQSAVVHAVKLPRTGCSHDISGMAADHGKKQNCRQKSERPLSHGDLPVIRFCFRSFSSEKRGATGAATPQRETPGCNLRLRRQEKLHRGRA